MSRRVETLQQTWERVELACSERCWACHDRVFSDDEAWRCEETQLLLCGYCFRQLQEGKDA